MSKKLWSGTIVTTVMLVVFSLLLMLMPACTKAPAPTTGVPAPTTSAPAPTTTTPAQAKTLIFESYVPPNSPAHQAELQFAQGLENATGGQVKTQHNVGSVMGPAQGTTTNLINGVCDWALFTPSYTPGNYPMTGMFELPIFFPDGQLLTKAMLAMYKKGYFDKEYANIKFLWFFVIGPYELFSNKKVSTFANFAGLKMRTPSEGFVAISKALSGVPVSVPGSEVYSSMEKGITDACWANGAQANTWKLAEVSKYIVMTNVSTSVMAVGMNKATFASLPEAAKKYIEDNRESYADVAAKILEAANVKGFDSSRQKNIEFITLSDADTKNMSDVLIPIFNDWAVANEAKGLPAKQALKDLYQILTDLGVKNPFPLPK